MTVRGSMIAAAVVLSATGCGYSRTAFVQTDSNVPLAARDTLPEVFLDKKPAQPYRSAGIIEVQSQGDLATIVDRAQRRGAELGCDVVIDRRLGLSEAPSPGRAEADVDGPLRVRAETPATGPLASPTLLAQAPQVVQPIYTVQAPPMERREFICGIYESTIEKKNASDAAKAETAAGTSAIWSKWSAAHGAKACEDALTIVRSEAACTGATCLAPLPLAAGFQSNCSPEPAVRIEVHKLRKQWEEASANASSPCLLAVARAASDAANAAGAQAACNAPTSTEAALRDAVLKGAAPAAK
ncbi:MAG: hypothetical protein U0441_38085 [Polyangiaceae bacterium]